MQRFFAFGCSFTRYTWPTWADLLGEECNSSNNWGHAGLGNRAIAERVAEAHAKFNFTKDDIVIVQWTSHLRHDWMNTRRPNPDCSNWHTKGSIYQKNNQELFGRKWMDIFWDEKAYYINTLNHILLTQGLLDSIGCNWFMTSMSDMTKLSMEVSARTVDGELPSPDCDLQDVWMISPDLLPYKTKIWDERPDKWIVPLMHICNDTLEEHYWFDYNNDGSEKGYNVYEGRWMEPHPSVNQHALWVLAFKKFIGQPVELTSAQQDIVDQFNLIKTETSYYKEFEARAHQTTWWMTNRYRGF